ncbi:sugar kinase [Maritalea porphyrae]|uniref:Ketodeoxygluconokinase n=1 Tax=Maritalea porphyrae TaxID=880732 RepID=A0ABQ5UYG7_9HYPH|nr:sugar kinase [Maritalea porphyrae]GLQ19012.1 ketodeoxygluconokinase [Maritalea porphyrae]
MSKSVVCVGEVMLELSGVQPDGSARFGFGGDTCNTAIYLSRLLNQDGEVGYLTRLGQGAFSDQLVASLKDEGLKLSSNTQSEAGTPGLYAISTDEVGERSFTYWRKDAVARELLTGVSAGSEEEFLRDFDALYFSGITLAVLSDEGRQCLLRIAQQFVAEGRTVMFDVNHRAHLWQSHAPNIDIQDIVQQAIAMASIVKVGHDEAQDIFGCKSPNDTVQTLSRFGDAALVVTDGAGRIVLYKDGEMQDVLFDVVADVIDSTAAGDSFSAGFLAAQLSGASFRASALAGQRVAARVIQFPGAIIPKPQTPKLNEVLS